jgi:hypothetical protein
MLSFSTLEDKFGSALAHHFLTEIEKAAGLSPWKMAHIDPETRLTNALHTQDVRLRNTPSIAA